MVEEKVSFQSDLRQANEQIEKLRHKLTAAENALIQSNQNSGSSHSNSDDVRKLSEAIAQKDSLLTARHQELEGARREVASVQASLLNVKKDNL